jgi:hypothetical protein
MDRMLARLSEPIIVFVSCKFTSCMSEKFPPFLIENGKDGIEGTSLNTPELGKVWNTHIRPKIFGRMWVFQYMR